MFNHDYQKKEVQMQSFASGKTNLIGRLDFIKKISLLAGAIATGCSPVKILLNLYPEIYNDNKLKEQIITAFITTVIPGANPNEPNLCRIFSDNYYPFYKYCGFFVSDLCEKSKNHFGIENFHELNLWQRTEIIKEGLKDEFTTSRIYTAAIYITQVSYYCSIYDEKKGCELIDFEGSYGFLNVDNHFDKDKLKLANEITCHGNYS